MKLLALAMVLFWLLPAPAPSGPPADDRVRGTETTHTSPNGVAERCVRIERAPGGAYSEEDASAEDAFCAIDLYANDVGLCPKVSSTSPGMVVHDLSAGAYAGRREAFMRGGCATGYGSSGTSGGILATFKPTVNGQYTSATFSAASLLYYHFSRYFRTAVSVPVAVWRTMDRRAHLEQVAEVGLSRSGNGSSSRMNHEGWRMLVEADRDPSSYRPTDELLTSDRLQIYGALVNGSGARYNSELNGTRASGWGRGQNLDFQETAPFRALRSDAPLVEAVAEGLRAARGNDRLRRDMAGDTSAVQMVFWMRELSEIVLLDYIFSQQDRIGNIDYAVRWYWTEAGEVRSAPAPTHGTGSPPAAGAVRIKRSELNDNDAAGRVAYANYAKTTGMLERLRHFDAGVYARLQALDADLSARGPLFDWVSGAFGLSARQVDQIVANTALAAKLLRDACQAGTLRFDLEPETFLVEGRVLERSPRCGAPAGGRRNLEAVEP